MCYTFGHNMWLNKLVTNSKEFYRIYSTRWDMQTKQQQKSQYFFSGQKKIRIFTSQTENKNTINNSFYFLPEFTEKRNPESHFDGIST